MAPCRRLPRHPERTFEGLVRPDDFRTCPMNEPNSHMHQDERSLLQSRSLALLFGLSVSALIVGLAWLWLPGLRPQMTQVTPGEEFIGIWENDPVLGFRHIPGAVGRHRKDDSFDVTYTIDDDGYRVTRDPVENGGRVIALGGSFTFGHGVEDDESWPAQLGQRWPHLKVVNAAANAWGTSHALLVLERELKRETPVLVLYGWLRPHTDRNSIRHRWVSVLAKYGRLHPHFELGPEGLEFRGVVGLEDAEPESTLGLDEKARNLTVAMVKKMHHLCEAAGVPFVVVPLLSNPNDAWLLSWPPLRVEDPMQYEPLPKDLHPSAASNSKVADHLADVLSKEVPGSPIQTAPGRQHP